MIWYISTNNYISSWLFLSLLTSCYFSSLFFSFHIFTALWTLRSWPTTPSIFLSSTGHSWGTSSRRSSSPSTTPKCWSAATTTPTHSAFFLSSSSFLLLSFLFIVSLHPFGGYPPLALFEVANFEDHQKKKKIDVMYGIILMSNKRRYLDQSNTITVCRACEHDEEIIIIRRRRRKERW